ncbi:hypothetical protein [Methylobacterium sp. SI9]|uniref:hypothetical protein n=1 Tax=Methylobacterium guangdongense TaxID=3138811 RepID=UPI00313C4314
MNAEDFEPTAEICERTPGTQRRLDKLLQADLGNEHAGALGLHPLAVRGAARERWRYGRIGEM